MDSGDNIKNNLSSWDFGGSTPNKLDEHISKSVPGYEFGQSIISNYSDFFVNLTPKLIYDIGCSTGSLLNKIDARHPEKDLNFIGIDIVPEMIEVAEKRKYLNPKKFKFECIDVLDMSFEKTSIIISYYTLQFILPSIRQQLVNRIYDIANSEVSIRENCGLLAYSPLAGGRLSGKYINKKPKNCRYTLWPKRFSRHHTVRGENAIKKYVKLAKKHNISSSILANSFVNSRPFVTSNFVGASSIVQLKENIDSISYKLTNKILDEIENIHLSDPNPCY